MTCEQYWKLFDTLMMFLGWLCIVAIPSGLIGYHLGKWRAK